MGILLNDSAFKQLLERKKNLLTTFEKKEIDGKTFKRLYEEVMFQIRQRQKMALDSHPVIESVETIPVEKKEKKPKNKAAIHGRQKIKNETIPEPQAEETFTVVAVEQPKYFDIATPVENLEKNEWESATLGSYRPIGYQPSLSEYTGGPQTDRPTDPNSIRGSIIRILSEGRAKCHKDIIRIILQENPLRNKSKIRHHVDEYIYYFSHDRPEVSKILKDYYWDKNEFRLVKRNGC
jgi:hypothetical protein